jgi:CRISPR/Cas system-associated exonuclease Cas4 (RecB family)
MKGARDLTPISLVAHHVFCPRRAWLEAMGETTDTHQMAHGTAAHRASDDPTRSRPDTLRSLDVSSHTLGITGRCDTVEIDDNGAATIVEYKSTPVRKRATVTEPMVVQLALQATALREPAGMSPGPRCISSTTTSASTSRSVRRSPPSRWTISRDYGQCSPTGGLRNP